MAPLRTAAWASTGVLTILVLSMVLAPAGAVFPTAAASPSIAAASAVAVPSTAASSLTHAPAATPSTLPAGLVPRVSYHGPTPAHVPAAWGGAHAPPGAPVPYTPAGMTQSTFLRTWSDQNQYPYIDGTCVGKWPSGGQSLYSNACIGHDEPAINPYSNLPGSGGNVSWNVVLPTDGSQTHNQSDVYIAIWFGMNLYDPEGYNGQCFLELQMYPDTSGQGTPVVGEWSGFLVAWQIELSTGFEDPCFAGSLNDAGNSTPFQMNGGDHLYVNMTGWQGSPWGENITVDDTSLGVSSFTNLYNTTYHYPLDPAYSANDLQDALPWSPGGDFPVSFAFESGHTVDDPENDTFGGCNSGAPPPTPLNPSTPCGPYNPKDWAMDTHTPWYFYPTSFFNAHTRQTAVQYGFEQDFGASAWIDGLSYGTCDGRDGSAYCSYPWYSYNAHLGAFSFGAVDYAGTTDDFGEYHEYASVLETDSSGLNFYPVKNFTTYSSSGLSLKVVVSGSGTVEFLSQQITSTTTLRGLPAGEYSINALPSSGSWFENYKGGGGASLSAKGTAWNSLALSANGTVTVTFGATAPSTVGVTLNDAGGHGTVTVVRGFAFPLSALYPPASAGFGLVPSFSSTATTVSSGTTLHLLPGIYSLQTEPNPGYNFTGWSSSGGVYVYTPSTNYTWVNVTTGGATVTAHFVASSLQTTVWLASYPAQGGTIRFGPFTYSSGATFGAKVGAYSVTAIPAPGYRFVSWGAGFMSTMTDWAASSEVLVQYSNSYLTAAFSADPVVTAGAVTGGGIAVNGNSVGTSVTLPQVGNLVYNLAALPDPGFTFSYWSVGNPAHAWIADPMASLTTFQLNGSVTIVPHYVVSATAYSVGVSSHGGTVLVNGAMSVSGSATLSLDPTTYLLTAAPNPGFSFLGWSATGGVTVSSNLLLVQPTMADIENSAGTWQYTYGLVVGGTGHVTARFAPSVVPVTFIDFPYDTSLSIQLSAHGSSFTIAAGSTHLVAPGNYTLTLIGGTVANLHWFASNNLTITSPRATSSALTVHGSGAIYIVAEPPHAGPVVLAPTHSSAASSRLAGSTPGPVVARRP